MGEARCCGRKMTGDEFDAHKADTASPCAPIMVAAQDFEGKHPENRLGASIAFWREVERRRKLHVPGSHEWDYDCQDEGCPVGRHRDHPISAKGCTGGQPDIEVPLSEKGCNRGCDECWQHHQAFCMKGAYE